MVVNFSYTLMWTILAIVFVVAEGLTMGLTTIWFAFGAIAAIIVASLKLNLAVQIVVFIGVSVITLVYTRPIAVRVLKIGATKTNAASLVGKKGIVKKEILPYATGQVKVNGQIWTAKSTDEEVEIQIGEEVMVENIVGVKLMVKKTFIEEKGGK